MRSRLAIVVLSLVAVAACGTSEISAPADAGAVADAFAFTEPDSSRAVFVEAGSLDASKGPAPRLHPHQGVVLESIRLHAVYVSEPNGSGGAQSFDAMMTWLVGSDGYWTALAQYGVGKGTFESAMRVSPGAFFPSGSTPGGIISATSLAVLLHRFIHSFAYADAGAPADASVDGSIDASDDAAESSAPDASPPSGGDASVGGRQDAYVLFLPDGVNVQLGTAATTCIDAGGYHDHDGEEPFAVIPPCAFGRSALAVSHEVAEMATEPIPGSGWYSDDDVALGGGEVGDLCNQSINVGGFAVTRLWSNAAGGCVP